MLTRSFEKETEMIANVEKFVRRTTLQADEYRKNFRQIDRDVIEVLKSAEAKSVTHLMGTLYLTLVDAPSEHWEREGVLRFAGGVREGKPCTAWQQLVALLDCGNSTAKKALEWMHEQGIIGYFAGKNGVGIRIFINRAAASIGRRVEQKNLRLLPTPASATGTPTAGTPFKDCCLEAEDTNKEFPAPKNGANTQTDCKTFVEPAQKLTVPVASRLHSEEREFATAPPHSNTILVDEVVERVKGELEPCVKNAAAHAAAQVAAREVARTREWFETKALPKAVRVAQHETYNLIRKHATDDVRQRRARADLQVGRPVSEDTPAPARPLAPEEICEAAEICVALLETQGQAPELTLSELCSENGGWLLPTDKSKVRDAVQRLMVERGERGQPDVRPKSHS